MERRRFLQIMSGVAAGAVAASAGGLDVFAAGRRPGARPRPSARYRAGTGTEKIVLVQNAWTASALDVAIAKKVIEDNLGNPVEITAIDENTMWSGLAGGDLDACLELWPSGISADEQKYLDDGSVAEAGKLGVIGQIGWFVPDYVIEEHPELATWEGYQDPEIGKLFSSPETGDLGRFLGTDPSYSQADETIIKNLGLPFQVVFSGSEPATVAALDSAVAAHEPILMYWWTPTAAAGKYNLVHVELPPVRRRQLGRPRRHRHRLSRGRAGQGGVAEGRRQGPGGVRLPHPLPAHQRRPVGDAALGRDRRRGCR